MKMQSHPRQNRRQAFAQPTHERASLRQHAPESPLGAPGAPQRRQLAAEFGRQGAVAAEVSDSLPSRDPVTQFEIGAGAVAHFGGYESLTSERRPSRSRESQIRQRARPAPRRFAASRGGRCGLIGLIAGRRSEATRPSDVGSDRLRMTIAML
jgi:hypothetical protein